MLKATGRRGHELKGRDTHETATQPARPRMPVRVVGSALRGRAGVPAEESRQVNLMPVWRPIPDPAACRMRTEMVAKPLRDIIQCPARDQPTFTL